MPTPAITLKLKRFRRRFGITAPRVTVRTHFDWHWYAVGAAFCLVLFAGLAWWLVQRTEAAQIGDEVRALREHLQEMESELTRLRPLAGTEQNAVRLERSAQQQLVSRLRQLEQENASLKADIGLFERLVPTDSAESALRVEGFNVVSAAEAGHYRYRLLVAFQPGKNEKEFRGRMQLSVLATQAGRDVQYDLHAGKETSGEFALEIRHFLRKEGSFILPAGAKIKSVEARLLQGAVVKVRSVLNF